MARILVEISIQCHAVTSIPDVGTAASVACHCAIQQFGTWHMGDGDAFAAGATLRVSRCPLDSSTAQWPSGHVYEDPQKQFTLTVWISVRCFDYSLTITQGGSIGLVAALSKDPQDPEGRS